MIKAVIEIIKEPKGDKSQRREEISIKPRIRNGKWSNKIQLKDKVTKKVEIS